MLKVLLDNFKGYYDQILADPTLSEEFKEGYSLLYNDIHSYIVKNEKVLGENEQRYIDELRKWTNPFYVRKGKRMYCKNEELLWKLDEAIENIVLFGIAVIGFYELNDFKDSQNKESFEDLKLRYTKLVFVNLHTLIEEFCGLYLDKLGVSVTTKKMEVIIEKLNTEIKFETSEDKMKVLNMFKDICGNPSFKDYTETLLDQLTLKEERREFWEGIMIGFTFLRNKSAHSKAKFNSGEEKKIKKLPLPDFKSMIDVDKKFKMPDIDFLIVYTQYTQKFFKEVNEDLKNQNKI